MKLALLLFLPLLMVGCATSLHSGAAANNIKWEPWSDDVFARAKKENRIVIMDLEAVWCHWCHVMEETTYQDPRVVKLINEHYIAVRVDQDSRPDLSNRYEDYGWPATIFFNGDGGEIVKRRGYIPPPEMRAVLEAIIKDPTPGPSVQASQKIAAAEKSSLEAALRKDLEERIAATYDDKLGSWGVGGQKFLPWDNVEYCLVKAAAGNDRARQMARQTLTAQRKLIDPVWGGVYQYSTDGDWDHAHFEKIMQMQAENLRIYSQAYALWRDPDDLDAARRIYSYLKRFLMSPEGAFYTSQDADLVPGEHSEDYFRLDDAKRRARGVPRVDTHVYSRENGWAITGLVALYCASGDKEALRSAELAAKWITDNRSLPEGGFLHDATDKSGPYLGDTLAMGRAFLALYAATAQRSWLDRAGQAAGFMDSHFRAEVGFATSVVSTGVFKPAAQFDENVSMARFANLLFHYTGDKRHRVMAEHAMKYLAAPQVSQSRGFGVGGILLADSELNREPPHVAVVGKRDDVRTQTLFDAAAGYFDQYKRLDLVSAGEPPLSNVDVTFPELNIPAAFLCANGSCSAPMSNPSKLLDKRKES